MTKDTCEMACNQSPLCGAYERNDAGTSDCRLLRVGQSAGFTGRGVSLMDDVENPFGENPLGRGGHF